MTDGRARLYYPALKDILWLVLLLLPAAAPARAADHPCQTLPQGPWTLDDTVPYLNDLRSLSDDSQKALPDEDRSDVASLNSKCASFDSLDKKQACGVLVDWGIVKKSGVRWSDDSRQWKRVHELDGGEVTGRFNKSDAQEVMERVCSAHAERQAAAKSQAQAQAAARPAVDPNEATRRAHRLLDEVCRSFGGCPSSPPAAPAAPPAPATSPGLTFRDLPQCAANDCSCLCKNAKAACGEQGPSTDRPGCTTQFTNAASCGCW